MSQGEPGGEDHQEPEGAKERTQRSQEEPRAARRSQGGARTSQKTENKGARKSTGEPGGAREEPGGTNHIKGFIRKLGIRACSSYACAYCSAPEDNMKKFKVYECTVTLNAFAATKFTHASIPPGAESVKQLGRSRYFNADTDTWRSEPWKDAITVRCTSLVEPPKFGEYVTVNGDTLRHYLSFAKVAGMVCGKGAAIEHMSNWSIPR